MLCSKCGNQFDETTSFCSLCGTKKPTLDQISQFQSPPSQQYNQTPIPPNKKNNIKNIAIIIGAILLAFLVLPILFSPILDELSLDFEKIAVPNVVGMTAGEAESAINSQELKFVFIDNTGEQILKYSAEEGKVVKQQPQAGAEIKRDDIITLTVSKPITIPDVVGKTVSEAEEVLSPFNVELKSDSGTEIDNKSTWQVKGQSIPPDTEVYEGESIILSVSDKSIVPDLIGMNVDEASTLLSNNCLQYDAISDTGKSVILNSNWIVLSQSIEPNSEVTVGTTVTLSVSKNSSSTEAVTSSDIKVSAYDLVQTYMNVGNQLLYEDKLIEVTGVVYSVEKVDSSNSDGFVSGLLSDLSNAVFGDTYAVKLDGGTVGYKNVFVDCFDMPIDQLSGLTVGSTVTVIGKCNGNKEHVNLFDSIVKP